MSLGNLIHHGWYTGTGPDSASGNIAVNASPYALAIDNNGIVYVSNTSGVVHRFDSSGNLLSTLGMFSFEPVQLKIMTTPSNGVWLIGTNGPVNGEAIQGICISGGPGAGTVTNSLGTMYGGIFSGGNSASFDVDVNGNIWLFERANGGPLVNVCLLLQVVFTGASTLAIYKTTDFSANHGWTGATGVLYNPVDKSLIVGGANSSGGITAKCSLNDPSGAVGVNFLATSTTINGNLAFQCGSNGHIVCTEASVQISEYDLTSLTLVRRNTNVGGALTSGVYDSQTSTFWVGVAANNNVVVYDMTVNPPTALTTLNDTVDNTQVVSGGCCVSPNGGFFVSVYSDGSTKGFIDFWQGKPAVLRVTDQNGNWTDSAGQSSGGGAHVYQNPLGSELTLRNSPKGSPRYNTAIPATLTISNTGGGNSLLFTITSQNQVGRSIGPFSGGDCGSAAVTISVPVISDGLPQRSGWPYGLAPGLYTHTLTITGAGGSVTVPVSVLCEALYAFGNSGDAEWSGY